MKWTWQKTQVPWKQHKVFSTSENFLKVWDSTRWNCSNNSKTNLRPRSISKEENKSNKLQRAWLKPSNYSLKFRGQDRHRKAQHREGRRANRYAQRWSLEVLEKRSWNFRSTRLRVQVKKGEGARFCEHSHKTEERFFYDKVSSPSVKLHLSHYAFNAPSQWLKNTHWMQQLHKTALNNLSFFLFE